MIVCKTASRILAMKLLLVVLCSSADAQKELAEQSAEISSFNQLVLPSEDAPWVLNPFESRATLFRIRKEIPGAVRNANVFERFEQNRLTCLASIVKSATCTPSTCVAAQSEYIENCFIRIPPSGNEFIPFGVKSEGVDAPITANPARLRETVAAIRAGETPVCSGFFARANGQTFFVSAEHCYGQIRNCKQPCLVRGNGEAVNLGLFVGRDIDYDISAWQVADLDGKFAYIDAENNPSRSSTLVGVVVGQRSNQKVEEMIVASGPQTDCRILWTTGPWRCHQCQTLPKSSGSPIFSFLDERWVVSGMHVSDGSTQAACRSEGNQSEQLPQLALAGSVISDFLANL